MMLRFKNFIADESGVTAIEYGLIASLIAVVAIGAFTAVGERLRDSMDSISWQIR